MKKLLLSLFCLLAVAASTATAHAEEITTTLAFDKWETQTESISSYTDTWDCYYGENVWSISNFNNNRKDTSWTYIKAGRKGNASTAAISTKFPIPGELKSVALTIDAITTTNITSITLYSSEDGSNWDTTNSLGSFNKAKGTQTLNVNPGTSDKYLKIEFVCTSASSNGPITISRVEYISEKSEAPVDPSFMTMTFPESISVPFNEAFSTSEGISFAPELNDNDDTLYEIEFSGYDEDELSLEWNKVTKSLDILALKGDKTYDVTATFKGTVNGTVMQKATANFKVLVAHDPDDITFRITNTADVEMRIGETKPFTYTIAPVFDAALGDKVEFTPSDTSALTIDAATKTITAGEVPGDYTVTITLTPAERGEHKFTPITTTFNVKVLPALTKYILVTDLKQLANPAKVIIACNTKSAVLGAVSGSYRTSVSASNDISTNKQTITHNNSFTIFEIKKGTNNGEYSLFDTTPDYTGYLNSTAAKSVSLSNSQVYPSISIDENANASINFGTTTGNLQYNASSPRFAAYTSTQTPIQLYVAEEDFVTPDENAMEIFSTPLEIDYHDTVLIDNVTFSNPLKNYSDYTVTYTPSDDQALAISKIEEGENAGKYQVKGLISGEHKITVDFSGFIGEKEYKASNTFIVHVGVDPFPTVMEITGLPETLSIRAGKPKTIEFCIYPAVSEKEEDKEIELDYDKDNFSFTFVSKRVDTQTDHTYYTYELSSDNPDIYEINLSVNAQRGPDGCHKYEKNASILVEVTEALQIPAAPTRGQYNLVKNLDEIGNGAIVAIANQSKGMAMGQWNASSYKDVEAYGLTLTKNRFKHNEVLSPIYLIKSDESDAYALLDLKEGKYIAFDSGNKLKLSDEPVFQTITINANSGGATIKIGTSNYLRYNSDANMFRAYASSSGLEVQLYKWSDVPDVTLYWTVDLDNELTEYTIDPEIVETSSNNYDLKAEDILLMRKGLVAFSENDFDIKSEVLVKNEENEEVWVNSKESDYFYAFWTADTFEFTNPGQYRLTPVVKSIVNDIDNNIIAPTLYITVNKINPEFCAFPDNVLTIDHQAPVYTPEYVEEDGKRKEILGTHELNEYELTLGEGDYFFRDDLDPFMVPTLTPQFEVEWNKAEIDKNDPAHHHKYGHLYYEHPEEIIVLSNALDFEGVVNPGKYTLKIEVAEPYTNWFTETSSENLLIIKPNIEAFDITRMKKTDEGFQFAYHPEDFPEGMTAPSDSNHEYFAECRFVRGHGGDIWYKLGYNSSHIEGPAYLGAEKSDITDKTDEELTADGYQKAEFEETTPAYSKPIDMRGATGIDLVEDVNGVRTQTPGITFNGNITTALEEISAIEVAEGETLYFTLQGIRVNADRLAPGIYVRRTATSTGLILIP